MPTQDDYNESLHKAYLYDRRDKSAKLLEVILAIPEEFRQVALDKQYEKGNTFLHDAINNGREDLAKILIDNGADVNIQNEKGFSPVHVASYPGNMKILQMLSEKDAYFTVETKKGLIPTDYATKSEIIGFLNIKFDEQIAKRKLNDSPSLSVFRGDDFDDDLPHKRAFTTIHAKKEVHPVRRLIEASESGLTEERGSGFVDVGVVESPAKKRLDVDLADNNEVSPILSSPLALRRVDEEILSSSALSSSVGRSRIALLNDDKTRSTKKPILNGASIYASPTDRLEAEGYKETLIKLNKTPTKDPNVYEFRPPEDKKEVCGNGYVKEELVQPGNKFKYDFVRGEGDPEDKTYTVKIPCGSGQDQKPNEFETLIFNKDGKLLSYETDSPTKSQLDQKWLKEKQQDLPQEDRIRIQNEIRNELRRAGLREGSGATTEIASSDLDRSISPPLHSSLSPQLEDARKAAALQAGRSLTSGGIRLESVFPSFSRVGAGARVSIPSRSSK